ncbi:KIAA1875 [Bugula neritina]|uniref:KIAA1875 n=1 Tax=Bugula neritina TaxID=10212 RepID=A0A7J7KIC6_BUGNE|nr:KIAA1875 [Bugula neritina]
MFNQCGLNDRHHFFTKEMDSWDTWAFEGVDRKYKISEICDSWLEKWMTRFQAHLKEGIEMLKRGQAVHSRVGRGQAKKLADKKAYTVTFNEPPSNSVIDKATWIECINYFCEMEVSNELNKAKAVQQADDKLVETKNTVLVLPKLRVKPALVRLGELHTGATSCKPDRETALVTTDLRKYHKNGHGEWALPPGQLYGFVPFIKQPVSRVYMNPFPSPIDKYDHYQQEPILITLKTSPKYFLHDESYPVPEVVM